MGFIIFGIILVAVGVWFAVFQRAKSANIAQEIQAQPTKTYDEVREMLAAMQDYDPNYRETVEFKGFAASSAPVVTPFSKTKVAYYVAESVQVSEDTEEVVNRDTGARSTRTTKHEDKISEEISPAELLVKDNAGNEIVIETRGVEKKLDLIKSYDVLDRRDLGNNNGQTITVSTGRGNNTTVRIGNGSGRRVIGYKNVEKTFPLGGALYVLGEAYMIANRIHIGPPRDSKQPFIVTTKSEEQMLKSSQSSQTTAMVGGIISIVAGLILFIVGVTR